MHRILFTSLDAAIAGFLMVPSFWLMNKKYIHNLFRTVLYFLFAVYLSAVFSIAGLPDIRYIRFDPHVNLDLFAYMFSDAINSLLNVILFLPMGFFLPILWRKDFSLRNTLLFGLLSSLLIELLQVFTLRATDVNDLLTNTVGALIGWGLSRLILLFPINNLPEGNPKDVFWVSGYPFFIMFFIHPFVADFIRMIL